MPKALVFRQVVLAVLERYLLIIKYCLMDSVNGVVYLFVEGLYAVSDVYGAAEVLGVVTARELLELFYQLVRFLLGEELRRRNGVRQNIKLLFLKQPRSNVVDV